VPTRRQTLQEEAKGIRQDIMAKKDFIAEDAAALIRKLSGNRANADNRKKLREAIRTQVARLELFRRLPEQLLKGFGGVGNRI
jgi:hypothetical protein